MKEQIAKNEEILRFSGRPKHQVSKYTIELMKQIKDIIDIPKTKEEKIVVANVMEKLAKVMHDICLEKMYWRYLDSTIFESIPGGGQLAGKLKDILRLMSKEVDQS